MSATTVVPMLQPTRWIGSMEPALTPSTTDEPPARRAAAPAIADREVTRAVIIEIARAPRRAGA